MKESFFERLVKGAAFVLPTRQFCSTEELSTSKIFVSERRRRRSDNRSLKNKCTFTVVAPH